MSLPLPVRYYPDPILERPLREVLWTNPAIPALLVLMRETILRRRGVGLAANQVGSSLRVCIIAEPRSPEIVMLNPWLAGRGPLRPSKEGCLSAPGIFAPVGRAEWVDARWTDLEGKAREARFEWDWARIVQHEVDHLDGLTIVHRMSPADRARASSAIKGLRDHHAAQASRVA